MRGAEGGAGAWGKDGMMERVIECFGDGPEIVGRDEPIVVECEQIERSRKALQRFCAGVEKVLVEIGHDKLAHGPIDRVAVAQHRVVCFADRAPMATFFEKRHHVIGIVFRGFQVEQERFFVVVPESGCGKHRALNAVCLVGAQYRKRRGACVSALFKIDRKRVKKILDFCRRVEFLKNAEFFSQMIGKWSHAFKYSRSFEKMLSYRRMFRHRRIFFPLIILGFFLIGSAENVHAVSAKAKPKPKPKPHPYVRIFYYQGGKAAKKSFFAHPKSIDVFAPQSYTLDAGGKLSGGVDDKLLRFARGHGIKVMPLVTNKRFQISAAHTLLDDPSKQDVAIASLIAEARDRQYWGWQFDFEQMDVSYRDRYSAFVKRVADEMHRHDLAMSVAVVAQVSQNPDDYPKDLWQRVIGVYDYSALASSSDFISVMSYDDPQSKGPVARYPWVRQVIGYSLRSVPKEKLSLGLPLYYWRWDTEREKLVGIGGYKHIKRVLAKHKVATGYSAVEEAPFIRYYAKKKPYTIWYENARSIAKKVALITEYGLHGFSAWALGLEVPDVHRVITTPPLTVSDRSTPTVQIGATKIPVELATTNAARQKGLSGRNSFAADRGMLFIFDHPDLYRFWMPDMHFPLDMIWIQNGKVVDISENVSNAFDPAHPRFYTPSSPAQYVLEVNAGFAKKHAIKIGDTIRFNLTE